MIFSSSSKIFEHLQAIRFALVSLVTKTEEIEQRIAATHGISLLGKYRDLIRHAAGDDAQLVEDYWLESTKETLGALGEPVNRSIKAWAGVYRSSLIDTLIASRSSEYLKPYPVEFLNRLEPATGRDQEFAYGILGKMAELRAVESRELHGLLSKFPLSRPDEIDALASAIGAEFELSIDRRGAKQRSLLLRRDAGSPFQLGICLQEGRFRIPSLSYFDLVIVERGGRGRLNSTGQLNFAFVGLERFFPGYAAGYGIYSSPDQLRLNVYAAFSVFEVLSSFFGSLLESEIERLSAH